MTTPSLPAPPESTAAQLAQRLVDQICRHSPAARSYRRPGLARDLLAWGRHYLAAYFRQPPSKMHRWLARRLQDLDRQRGARLNVLAPRGSAKSTLATVSYVLKCALEAREPYIWILSATLEQARIHLGHIRAELEANPLLAHAYLGACGRGPSWRAAAIVLPNGVGIEAFGTGQQLRGRRRRESRPSLIVCDDLENDRLVASPQQRAACREWFHGVVLKAGDERTNVVNLATALHRDALAMQLDRSPGWTSAVFRAIERWPDDQQLWQRWEEIYCNCDDAARATHARQFFEAHRPAMEVGAELLWPEKEDLYSLMKMRVDEGRIAFEREKQNSPVDPALCEWPEEYFDHHIWFQHWPKPLIVRVIALDPSKGADARHGDYSAYVMLGLDEHGVWYVQADMDRRPISAMVAQGVRLCRNFAPQVLGVEANQYQELLEGAFDAEFSRQKRTKPAIKSIDNYVNKRVRIRTIEPLLSRRLLRFHAPSAGTHLLVNQLRDFPLGDHDDGPDALEMAIRLALELLEGPPPDDGLGDRLIA
jgi:hypothetical protein